MHALRSGKYRDWYRCLDVDGNGRIEWDDFRRSADSIRREMGWAINAREFTRLIAAQRVFWEELLARLDEDVDGTISEEEFVTFYEGLCDEIQRSGGLVPTWVLLLAQSFHASIDLDGNGLITETEYAIYLRSIGSDADHHVAFAHLDTNGDGVLSIDEIEDLVSEWIVSDDVQAAGNWLVTGRLRSDPGLGAAM